MKIFYSNYHISVNDCFVEDVLATGNEVVMPSIEFAKNRIWFFAANDEHKSKGAQIVSYDEFMAMEPMAIVIPCNQMIDDFMKLYEARGKVDKLIYLTAQSNSVDTFPLDGADYVISHDLWYHRRTKAKYKIWYFSRPKVTTNMPKDFVKTFNEKKIKLFINGFIGAGFEPEYFLAKEFRDIWKEKTGYEIPFYGHGNEKGPLMMEQIHNEMLDSMFTLVFKRRETWGQMVNESMLLGTPIIFCERFINSTFKEYEINTDNSMIMFDRMGIMAEDLLINPKDYQLHEFLRNGLRNYADKLINMTLEEYETMCMQAKTTARLYTSDQPRRDQLAWLFSKITF